MEGQKPETQVVPPIPTELASWLAGRLRQMEALMVDISRHESDDESAWCVHILGDLSQLEDLSTEATRLMTRYVKEKTPVRDATIAKVTGVHQSSVSARAGSDIARDAWAEIWPA